MKRSIRIKILMISTWRRSRWWSQSAEDLVTKPTTPDDVEATRQQSSMSNFCVSEPAELLSNPLELEPPVPYEEWLS
jgi:hypothetical protein